MSQFFIQCEPIFFHCYTVIETTSPCYYCVGTLLRKMTNIDDGADIGSFHDKSPQKKFFFNHYISDFDENWCMWLSYSQNLLVQILRFYD